jgi:hypothetical protein
MQTIDDLDLLKYVAGGMVSAPGDGGDGDGDGDDGDTDAAAESSVCTAATALADSGIETAANSAVAAAGASGVLAQQVEALSTQAGLLNPTNVAEYTGYEAAIAGKTYAQAQASNASVYSVNAASSIGFAAGYVFGYVKSKM